MPFVTLPIEPRRTKPRHGALAGGFTLVELTIVLIIVALLLGTLMVPLSTQIDQRNYNDTQRQMDEIREALIGFAVVNGRLPRPATSPTDGAENPAICVTDDKCTGFIPWTTLGVKKTDAWNKLIRYSVTPAFADAAFTLTTAGNKKIQTRDNAGVTSYLVGSASACAPCAPAIVYSTGKANWGHNDDGSALADTSTTNTDEDTNASATKEFFARGQFTVANGGEFDDIVIWIPPFVLFNRMIAAGKLP